MRTEAESGSTELRLARVIVHHSRTLSESRVRRTAIVVGLTTALLLTACEQKEEKPKAGPPDVTVADVVQQDVPVTKDWVAQLNGPVNAEITPKVQGYLLRQDYPNGFFVKKGELLFELDPRQYLAALDKAKADVASCKLAGERGKRSRSQSCPSRRRRGTRYAPGSTERHSAETARQ